MRRASAEGANSQRRRFKVCSYKSVGAPSNRGHLKRSVGINKSINKKKRALSIRLDKATHSWPQSVACFSRDVNVVGSRSEESTCPHPSILSPLPPPRCTVVVQDEPESFRSRAAGRLAAFLLVEPPPTGAAVKQV